MIDENIAAAMTRRSLIDQRTAGSFTRHIDLAVVASSLFGSTTSPGWWRC
jgi:hypothetical protein